MCRKSSVPCTFSVKPSVLVYERRLHVQRHMRKREERPLQVDLRRILHTALSSTHSIRLAELCAWFSSVWRNIAITRQLLVPQDLALPLRNFFAETRYKTSLLYRKKEEYMSDLPQIEAPPSAKKAGEIPNVDINRGNTIQFDQLGPIVVC